MKKAILFDLGNTLVQYYEMRDFPDILRQAILEAAQFLGKDANDTIADAELWQRVRAEDFEAKDYCVRPLEERLTRIFQLSAVSPDFTLELCRRFMQPIFACAKVYDDTLPTLSRLRMQGFQTAIISNTPWGSPSALWREECARLRLDKAADLLIFCSDCGWRKPAPQIFHYALEKLAVAPEECLFVGDDPRWDIVGPRSVGIEAILIDRTGIKGESETYVIQRLEQLFERLERG